MYGTGAPRGRPWQCKKEGAPPLNFTVEVFGDTWSPLIVRRYGTGDYLSPGQGARGRPGRPLKEAPLAINQLFAGVAVADYDSALVPCERFFGRSPDIIVTENEAMWQVADTGWIYVVGDTNRAGKALLTLMVDDLEAQVAELGERGLETSAIDTMPGLYRKAVITDPDGNMISLGEDLSTGSPWVTQN